MSQKGVELCNEENMILDPLLFFYHNDEDRKIKPLLKNIVLYEVSNAITSATGNAETVIMLVPEVLFWIQQKS